MIRKWKRLRNAAFFRTMRQDVGIVSRRNGRCRGMEVAGMSRYYLDEMDAAGGWRLQGCPDTIWTKWTLQGDGGCGDVQILSGRNGRCRGMEVAGMSRYYLDEMDAVFVSSADISSAILFMATHSSRVTCPFLGSYFQGLKINTLPAATASNNPSDGL